jgi:hypothetical protein
MNTSTAVIKASTRIGCSLAALLFATLITQASTELGPWIPMFKGVDYAVGTNTPGNGGFPELQVINALRINLADPDVVLFTTPRITNYLVNSRETGGLTVSDFVKTYHVQAAINANMFDPESYYLAAGTPMTISGLAISQGEVVSTQQSAINSAAVMFTQNNEATIVFTNWPAVPTDGIYTAVSGTYPLLIGGSNIGYRYRSDSDVVHHLQPRTAIGLSADRKYLFLLLIDGRQPGYSSGAYDYETAEWLRLLGASDGVNMDGGGSTTLVMQDSTGKPVRLNRSSAVADSGRERTLGSHFGFYAKPLPGFVNDVTVNPSDTTALITWTTAEPSTTMIRYGITADLGSNSTLQSELVTNHLAALTDLTPGTDYFFAAVSATAVAEYSSPVLSFTTANYATTNLFFDLTWPWKFTSANLDQLAWTAPTYDDSGWDGPGQGLFWIDVRAAGPNAEVQPKTTQLPADPNNAGYPFVTYYFRTHFNFTNSTSGVSLVFSNYLDDGAVFYLNGVEVSRSHMTPYPAQVYHDTLATSYGGTGDAITAEVLAISGSYMTNLVAGDNVLAVEVHNYNARSPDTTFGMSMFYTQPRIESPRLTIVVSLSAVSLSWSAAGFTLQQANFPSGPWTDSAGPITVSPCRIPISGSAQYYRLRH